MKKSVIIAVSVFLVVILISGFFGIKFLQQKAKTFLEGFKQQFLGKEGLESSALGSLCSNQEECIAFCSANSAECQKYCNNNPSNLLCQSMTGSMYKIEDICLTREECEKFCLENPENEMCNRGSEGKESTETPELSMPFSSEEYSPVYWGLWPFCVHGGDHPEGHGGIDFELKAGTKIYSASDGKAEYIEQDSGYEEGGGITITSGRIAIAYYGIVNIQFNRGDSVKKGDYIGDAIQLKRGEYFIHFEVNDYINEKLKCPTQYLDAEFKSALQDMFERAHYPEQMQEPELCNCEWLPYKPNQQKK